MIIIFYQMFLLILVYPIFVNFNESNIYRKQRVYENTFDYIEITIKNQDNVNIEMKDFFKSVFILVVNI